MSEIDKSKVTGVGGENNLPDLPKWGVHRKKLEAADAADPTNLLNNGVVAHEWEDVWVDIFVDAAVPANATATFEVWFWSEVATVKEEFGQLFYEAGWVLQDVVADIAVVEADGGHKTILVPCKGRSFYLKLTALGTEADAYV